MSRSTNTLEFSVPLERPPHGECFEILSCVERFEVSCEEDDHEPPYYRPSDMRSAKLPKRQIRITKWKETTISTRKCTKEEALRHTSDHAEMVGIIWSSATIVPCEEPLL